ncbi:MAG: cobalt-precorrin-5B (C(1))-methyltransferase CbiD [Thermostichus sp. DG_1_6_bins_120]
MPDVFRETQEQGYTLPVFAVAAAKAALHHLLGIPLSGVPEHPTVCVQLQPEQAVGIPVEQLAAVDTETALAITRSDPGPHLDLTRNTPIWAWVRLEPRAEGCPRLILEAGEGLGRHTDGQPAIYAYARQLFELNLLPHLPIDCGLRLRIILPEGKRLAERTSNAAFGVLEGLALLGTRAEVEASSSVDSLEKARHRLQQMLEQHKQLAFCVGSHGQQVALRQGIPAEQVLLVANWMGPLLVEAALRGAKSIHLLGYHGKLIKLAGGIFNTSSHVADARLEILLATLIRCGGTAEQGRQVLNFATVEAAVGYLNRIGWGAQVMKKVADQILEQAERYIRKYADSAMELGVTLFDRQGGIVAQSGIPWGQDPVVSPES